MWWEYLTAEIEAEFLRLSRGRDCVLASMSLTNPADVGVSRTARGRWFITPHAVQAYRSRVRQCSPTEAMDDLIAISQKAHYVKPAKNDAELWRGPRARISGRRYGGLRLIVGPGTGTMPALLTVLGEHDDATVVTLPDKIKDLR